VPISVVTLHDEAAFEYDAAFDWYLERSPGAALKFDSEVQRAIEEIAGRAAAMGAWFVWHSAVSSARISFSADVSGAEFPHY